MYAPRQVIWRSWKTWAVVAQEMCANLDKNNAKGFRAKLLKLSKTNRRRTNIFTSY